MRMPIHDEIYGHEFVPADQTANACQCSQCLAIAHRLHRETTRFGRCMNSLFDFWDDLGSMVGSAFDGLF